MAHESLAELCRLLMDETFLTDTRRTGELEFWKPLISLKENKTIEEIVQEDEERKSEQLFGPV
jgi:hypothetical protein